VGPLSAFLRGIEIGAERSAAELARGRPGIADGRRSYRDAASTPTVCCGERRALTVSSARRVEWPVAASGVVLATSKRMVLQRGMGPAGDAGAPVVNVAAPSPMRAWQEQPRDRHLRRFHVQVGSLLRRRDRRSCAVLPSGATGSLRPWGGLACPARRRGRVQLTGCRSVARCRDDRRSRPR